MFATDYPDKFFDTNEWVYHLAGIWLFVPPNTSIFRKFGMFLWTSLIASISIYFLVLELLVFRVTVHDIKKFISQFGMLLTHVFGNVRVGLLLKQHQRLLRLQGILQDKDYFYENCGDFVPGEMMKEAKKVSSTWSIMLYTLYSLVGVLTFISTEVTIRLSIKEEKLQNNETCDDYMPYYFVIPFDATTRTNCRWANLLLSFPLTTYAWVISCHDGLLAALLNCLKTQMLILCGAMRTIRPRILKRLHLSSDLEVLHDEDVPGLEPALYNELIHMKKHLILLLKTAGELEDIFTFMTLCQTLASLIMFASCLFIAASVPVSSPIFFSQTEYFLCVLVQFSVFCWFGGGITIASEEINLALYSCDWYSASKRFKSAVITTMCRMQRPTYLTIGKFSPLTLNAMVTVCKASMSYYAVFKQVSLEEE